MGLTRIRAQQITDIDYKQAVRVATTGNVTLSGGAPTVVDGVTLALDNRILVRAQSNAAENGIYFVSTLGTGSNGTWTRTNDANQTGEIDPGMVVMVTEGDAYADTPWKLVTNGEIVIGVTELTFEQFSDGTAAGANTQIQFNNAGDFAGSANLTWNGTELYVNGAANVTGNISGNIVIANSIQTDNFTVDESLSIGQQIIYAQGANGFSVNENFDAGNSTVTAYHYTSGSGRNAIVFDTAVTGQFTTGFGTAGTAASNKFVFFAEFGNTFWEWRKSVGISAPNLNGGTLLANISADGNLWTAGTITGTGNITGDYFIGNGSQLTGIDSGGISWTTQANTAPASPAPGDFWYDSFTGIKYQYINDGTGNVWVDQSAPTTFSSISTGQILNSGTSGVGNIGSEAATFNTVFAKATSAQYADLAEKYSADAYYAPGTVVVFGGTKEITQSVHDHDHRIAGVISTNPAFIMNNLSNGLLVALTGRVPCLVQGPVTKGDLVVSSNIPGTAQRLVSWRPGCVIGKSLEDISDNSIKTIEVVIGRF